jgi:hypothetical protein
MGEKRNACRILVVETLGERSLKDLKQDEITIFVWKLSAIVFTIRGGKN